MGEITCENFFQFQMKIVILLSLFSISFLCCDKDFAIYVDLFLYLVLFILHNLVIFHHTDMIFSVIELKITGT